MRSVVGIRDEGEQEKRPEKGSKQTEQKLKKEKSNRLLLSAKKL